MNYTTITINDKKVGLKFGMASFRYLSDKFVDGISFENGELNEIGVAHLVYSGYYNNCLVKGVLPEMTFENLVDYVETNILKNEFLEELKEIIKVWGESDMIKSNVAASEEVDDKAKKKSSRGRK
jgi:hypothetical protein